MPSPSRSIDLRQASWRPTDATGNVRLRRRWLWRIAALLVLAALFFLFSLALFRPLFRPATHLELLAAMQYAPLRAPAAEYVDNDLASFAVLAPALMPGEGDETPVASHDFSSQTDLAELTGRLGRAVTDGADVIVVYVSAHGVSHQGEPYLLCGDRSGSAMSSGRVRLSQLMEAVSSVPAKTKLVLLDAGRVAHDPRSGVVVNEFPRLIQDAVTPCDDANLWAIVSHGELQTSHVSPALQRSVFGYFVARGLAGAADANGDRAIDLAELHRFVAANVSTMTERQTSGRARQTPQLFWGGSGEMPAAKPILLSTSRIADPSSSREVAQEVEAVNSGKARRSGFTARSLLRDARAGALPTPGQFTPRALSIRAAGEARTASNRQMDAALAEPPPESPATKAEPDASAAAPPAAASPAAASPDSAAPSADGQGQSDQPSSEKKPTEAAVSAPVRRLTALWKRRDEMQQDAEMSLARLAPAAHWWRLCQERLVALEARYRFGEDDEEILRELSEVEAALDALSGESPTVPAEGNVLAEQVRELIDSASSPPPLIQTLAQARQVATSQRPLRQSLQEAAAQFSRIAREGAEAEFTKWVAAIPPELLNYQELRLAHRLSTARRAPWRVVQLALAAEAAATQATAVEPWLSKWLAPRIGAADRWRLDGQRTILDGIGPDIASRAERKLGRALTEYAAAEEDARTVRAARLLLHRCLSQAPYFLRWAAVSGASLGRANEKPTPQADQLDVFFQDVARLAAMLDKPDARRLGELLSLTSSLDQRRQELQQGYSSSHVEQLSQEMSGAGASVAIDQLLKTPLPSAADRVRLLAALAKADAEAVKGHGTIYLPDSTPRNDSPSSVQWRRLVRLLALETKVAQIAASATAADQRRRGQSSPEKSHFPTLAAVESAAAQTRRAMQSRGMMEKPGASSEASVEQAMGEFGAALKEFYRRLPDELQSISSRAMRTAAPSANSADELLAVRRAVYFIDPRDARAVKLGGAWKALAARFWRQDVDWRRGRMLAASLDAPLADLAYYRQAAHDLALLLENDNPPGAEPPPPQAMLSAPSKLSLIVTPSREFVVSLNLRSVVGATPVWLVLDYDPTLLDIDAGPATVWPEHDQPSGREAYPYRPDRLNLPASFEMASGINKEVRFKINRLQAGGPTRLIVKAIVPRAGGRDNGDEATIVRAEIDVALPSPELVKLDVRGHPGAWSPLSDGVQLHPFPYGKTRYQLRLANLEPGGREVHLAIYAPRGDLPDELPNVELLPEIVEEILQQAQAGPPVVAVEKLALPADDSFVPIPFPPPPEAPKPKPDGGAGPEAKVEVVFSDEALPIGREMLVVLTDAKTGASLLKRLSVTPQRPRRYLHAEANYDAQEERVEIHFIAEDAQLLPPGGSVVKCEFLPPLPPGSLARLEGTVPTSGGRLFLHAELPRTSPPTSALLHVDGFPRAFLFSIDPRRGSHSIDADTDALAVRIIDLPQGKIYPDPAADVPVVVAVDAPPGSFRNPYDVVRVGVDKDRDRELTEDEAVAVHSDREVRVALDHLAPEGELWLDVRVSDLHLSVPGPGLFNSKANVVAQVVAGGRSQWSDPIGVVFDTSAPAPLKVALTPGREVAVGQTLEVRIRAADATLSGVAKVEAGLNAAADGTIPEAPPPVVATLGDTAGEWIAKVPAAAPGPHQLVVRLTDRAGNASVTSHGKVRVATPEELEAEAKAKVNRVFGVVVYGDQLQSGAEVRLESESGAKLGPVTTGEDGKFSFPQVPVGKWNIYAEGLVRGANRVYPFKEDEKKTVDVVPPPKTLKSLTLPLKTPR